MNRLCRECGRLLGPDDDREGWVIRNDPRLTDCPAHAEPRDREFSPFSSENRKVILLLQEYLALQECL